MVLDECCHHEARRLVEVYDHPQPSPWVKITPVEALASGGRILLANVGAADRVQDPRDVPQHPRPTAREVGFCAVVEHDAATIRVGRLDAPS